MVDFTTRPQAGPQSRALHFSYEKAGLVLDNQPIPWNAEAVLVEAQITSRGGARRPLPVRSDGFTDTPSQRANEYRREDFALRLAGASEGVRAESLKQADMPQVYRVFFRLPVPSQSTSAEFLWRGHSRGQLQLQVLQPDEFRRHLSLQMAGLSVRLGEQTVSCQAAVTAQCQDIVMSALVSSATSLAPILDLGLRVRMLTDKGANGREEPVHFSHAQLKARQALLAVMMPRPRKAGSWLFQWLLGDTVLAEQKFRSLTAASLHRSLRVSATRFVLQYADGRLFPTRTLPDLSGVERVGPCFLVASSLPGLAGWCDLEVRARHKGPAAERAQDSVLHRQRILLTDGVTPVAMGTLDVDSLRQVEHFELRCRNRLLGLLPVGAYPTSTFNSEGGFQPVEDFPWSPAAEEQLQEKLNRLLGGK